MTDPRKEPQCLAFQPPPRSMPLPPLHGRLLEGVKKQLGVVPNMFRLVANSPPRSKAISPSFWRGSSSSACRWPKDEQRAIFQRTQEGRYER